MRCFLDGRWDFQGATIVTNNYVRLTADRQSQAGSIWNSVVSCRVRISSASYDSYTGCQCGSQGKSGIF